MFLLLPSATGQGSNQAEDISIEDTEDAFTADNVEDALFELANRTASDIPFDSAEFAGVLSGLQDNVIQTALAALDLQVPQITLNTYIPSLIAADTNPTLGTGNSVQGWYITDGIMCSVWVHILFGSAGVNAGSGFYEVNPPVPILEAFPAGGPNHLYQSLGQGWCKDVDISTNNIHVGVMAGPNGNFRFQIPSYGSGTSVSDDTPFTWDANDVLTFFAMYPIQPSA